MKYNFANCTLDEARLTLTRGGLPVSVEPRVLDLIQVLVRSGGDLVTRDQLVEDVWQGRIVSESAISACIAAARKAVGDDGKAQAVIRTVARRGLIMAADVTTVSDKKAPRTSSTAQAVQRIRYTQDKNGHQLAYSVTGSGAEFCGFHPLLPLTLNTNGGFHVRGNLLKQSPKSSAISGLTMSALVNQCGWNQSSVFPHCQKKLLP